MEDPRTQADLVADHVGANVTLLVQELVDCDSELGREIMFGFPESEMLAYDAHEVWTVSQWLATRLIRHVNRVVQVGTEHYWARGATGQAIRLDKVIVEIAEEMTR